MIIVFSLAGIGHGLRESIVKRRVAILCRNGKRRANDGAFHRARIFYISLRNFLRRSNSFSIAGAAKDSQQGGAQSFLLISVVSFGIPADVFGQRRKLISHQIAIVFLTLLRHQ